MQTILMALMTPALLAQAPAPTLSIPVKHHDFGKVNGDAKVTHRFKVSNTGTAPLQISGVNPSCGCTSSVLGQWYLKPGESSEVEVSFNPKGFKGLVRKSIQVVSNDPQAPTQVLTFDAEITQEIMVSSENLFFQEIIRSAPNRKATVHLGSGNGQPVKVTDARSPGAPYLETVIRQLGKDVDVDVILDSRKLPAGKPEGVDSIVLRTGNPRQPTVTLNVQWMVKSPLSAEPGKVIWLEPAGKELRAKVTLHETGGRPIRILAFKATNPLLRVEGLHQAASAHPVLEVILGAAAKAGLYNESIYLTTDDPDQPEFALRVSANLR
jgi:hypothetical protein